MTYHRFDAPIEDGRRRYVSAEFWTPNDDRALVIRRVRYQRYLPGSEGWADLERFAYPDMMSQVLRHTLTVAGLRAVVRDMDADIAELEAQRDTVVAQARTMLFGVSSA